jgi:hypothetical protein
MCPSQTQPVTLKAGAGTILLGTLKQYLRHTLSGKENLIIESNMSTGLQGVVCQKEVQLVYGSK